MRDSARENLAELLRRFMDESAARTTHEDIRAGERIIEDFPAPAPAPQTLWTIESLMAATAIHRRRRIRIFRSAVAAAAAVILTVLIGQYGRTPTDRGSANFAAIIPTAVWESDDLAADDLDLAYFTAEIRQIEAQVRALETGETGIRGEKTLDELEIELMAMETEFWRR